MVSKPSLSAAAAAAQVHRCRGISVCRCKAHSASFPFFFLNLYLPGLSSRVNQDCRSNQISFLSFLRITMYIYVNQFVSLTLAYEAR